MKKESIGSARGAFRASGEALNDLDVLLQSARNILPVPRDAVVTLERGGERSECHSRVGQFLDVLAGQGDAQTFGDESHQRRLQLGVLQNARYKARRLARA